MKPGACTDKSSPDKQGRSIIEKDLNVGIDIQDRQRIDNQIARYFVGRLIDSEEAADVPLDIRVCDGRIRSRVRICLSTTGED